MTDRRPEEIAPPGRFLRLAAASFPYARDVSVIALLLAGVLELAGIHEELARLGYYQDRLGEKIGAAGDKLDVLAVRLDVLVAAVRSFLFR